MTNTLFTGDNLYVLTGMNSACVDLIYLDPPFNSKRMYSAPMGSQAAGSSFKDMWTWKDIDECYLEGMFLKHPELVQFIDAVGSIHGTAMKSYLAYMTQRIIELHRVLKSHGSVYVHCDPSASHYLKIVLDEVFGQGNFRNEIVWKRYAAHSLAARGFDSIADSLLLYAKNVKKMVFHPQFGNAEDAELVKRFPHLEAATQRRYQHVALEQSSNHTSAHEIRLVDGHEVRGTLGWRWSQATFDQRLRQNPHIIYWTKTGRPRYKIYADEYKGTPLGNIWLDIPYLSAGDSERVGYPTQKPLALLKRIIQASSQEGDVVLDPFCGCATTMVAAQQLGRNWIGIDISEKAAELVAQRLRDDAGLLTDFVHRKDVPQRTDMQVVAPIPSIKAKLHQAQHGLCNGCSTACDMRNLEIDHIIPKAKGGGDYYQNFQLLCRHCKCVKGSHPREYLNQKFNATTKKLSRISFGE